VKLGFAAEKGDAPGKRVFDIKLQGETVKTGFDPVAEAGKSEKAIVLEFKGIEVTGNLSVELIPTKEKSVSDELPVINYMEIIREDAAK
jgi:hypothetical protein